MSVVRQTGLGCVLLACIVLAATVRGAEEAGEILDNAKLISMLKAQISLPVIKTKIENSSVRFVADSDQLILISTAAHEGGMEKKDVDELLTIVIQKANLEKNRIKELVDRFMNVCVNGDPTEYDTMMRSLLGEGRACVPQLLKHTEEENEVKRRGVVDALGRIGDKSPAVVNRVRLLLTDRHPDVRQEAAKAVAALALPTTVDELIEVLNRRQAEYVDGVALALGELRDPKAVAPLTTLLTLSTEAGNRRAAATALGQLRTKDDRAIKALLAGVLDARDPQLRVASARALGLIGEVQTVGYIIRSFQRFGDVDGRAHLITELRHFKSLAALDFLVPCTNDDAPDIRKAAVETLKVLTGANGESREEWESIVNVIRDRPDWRDSDKATAVKAP
jgi:HEAT repeat protein